MCSFQYLKHHFKSCSVEMKKKTMYRGFNRLWDVSCAEMCCCLFFKFSLLFSHFPDNEEGGFIVSEKQGRQPSAEHVAGDTKLLDLYV